MFIFSLELSWFATAEEGTCCSKMKGREEESEKLNFLWTLKNIDFSF